MGYDRYCRYRPTWWAKKVSYCTLSISSLNIDQFSQFLPMDSVRNLLLSGIHTTLIVSLHYLVKYKYPKTHVMAG